MKWIQMENLSNVIWPIRLNHNRQYKLTHLIIFFYFISIQIQLSQNIEKWYEINDLAYLLSPNSSFDKGISVSEGLLEMLDELKDQNISPKNNAKRIDVFKRLKNKFSILLPPANVDVR